MNEGEHGIFSHSFLCVAWFVTFLSRRLCVDDALSSALFDLIVVLLCYCTLSPDLFICYIIPRIVLQIEHHSTAIIPESVCLLNSFLARQRSDRHFVRGMNSYRLDKFTSFCLRPLLHILRGCFRRGELRSPSDYGGGGEERKGMLEARMSAVVTFMYHS